MSLMKKTISLNKKIIGFAGRKRSGKSALCEHLKETQGATIITIASALKELCADMLNLSVDELLQFKDDINCNFIPKNNITINKVVNVICQELPNTPMSDIQNLIKIGFETGKFDDIRSVLQYVGTDILRKYNNNWHVEKMIQSIKKAPSDIVVIDDVRFPNEYEAINDLGGTTFFIIRPDLNISISNHISETSLSWQNFKDDRIIINMFDLNFLFQEFDFYLNTNFIFGANSPIFKQGASEFIYNVNLSLGFLDTTKNDDEKEFIKNYILPNLNKDGSFVIHSNNEKESYYISKLLYNNKIKLNKPSHSFIIWNPFIIENLKRWI